MAENIPIASDHAGVKLKARLGEVLAEAGFEVEDMGPYDEQSTDYADYAHPLADKVSSGKAKRGILLCGTGLGMSYVANRYPDVRAAVAWSKEVAELSRQHNDSNILVLPARFLSDNDAVSILKTWLSTGFEGGRHERRVAKIERDDKNAEGRSAGARDDS